jgi:hypothetical protein
VLASPPLVENQSFADATISWLQAVWWWMLIRQRLGLLSPVPHSLLLVAAAVSDESLGATFRLESLPFPMLSVPLGPFVFLSCKPA